VGCTVQLNAISLVVTDTLYTRKLIYRHANWHVR